jgi:hypothetical protein
VLSVNAPDTEAWLAVLHGLEALTNSSGQLQPIALSSNSPQAAMIADAIQRSRLSQPGGHFTLLADILATPELTTGSPFLDTSTIQQLNAGGITDAAMEILPGQLLSRLRSDSIGTITSAGGQVRLRFSGYDGVPYRLERSSNLADWIPAGTNYPVDGTLVWTNVAPSGARLFYRSVLLP